MARGKKKTQEVYWLIAIVVAVVFVGSLFAVFTSAPDQVFARSADGAVTLKAVTDSASGVEIVVHDVVYEEIDHLVSPVYELSAGVGAVILDGDLSFEVQSWGEGLDLTEAEIFVIDPVSLSADTLSTSFDLSKRVVSAPIEFSGTVYVALGIVAQGE